MQKSKKERPKFTGSYKKKKRVYRLTVAVPRAENERN